MTRALLIGRVGCAIAVMGAMLVVGGLTRVGGVVSLVASLVIAFALGYRLGPWVGLGPDDDVDDVDELDEASCVLCGCTENDACDGGCHWVANRLGVDVCSACVDELAVLSDRTFTTEEMRELAHIAGGAGAGAVMNVIPGVEFPERVVSEMIKRLLEDVGIGDGPYSDTFEEALRDAVQRSR